MTTAYHTALAANGPLTSAAMEAPLGQLDAGIGTLATAIGGTALPITTTNGTASSGQKVVPVTATTGFIVGMSVWIGDLAGTYEIGVIASISVGVSLTMVANLVSTYAAGKIVSASPNELVDARAGSATVQARLRATAGTSGTAFPGSPTTNDIFVRTDRGSSSYKYTGAAWTQIDIPAVTAFWGTPSTNDRAYRTDLNATGFWNGTRWLNAAPTIIPIGSAATSTTGTAIYVPIPNRARARDLWVEAVDFTSLVVTTNTGANYWTMQVQWARDAGVTGTLSGFTTAADTPDIWTPHSNAAVNTLFTSTVTIYTMLYLYLTKTGAPGVIDCGAIVYAREVLV